MLQLHRSLRILPVTFLLVFSTAHAQRITREAVLDATLIPYRGPTWRGVDTSTLAGKVMAGYQGWFNCEGDGAEQGWVHWTKGRGAPGAGNVKVDLWPDVSELAKEDRFDTALRLADGSPAQVFSSYRRATVLKHFEWMKTYGLDGVFVQRFAVSVRSPHGLQHNNTVLLNCREGAHVNGRAYALMYDLTGLREGQMDDVIEDFRLLRTRMKLGDAQTDKAYLKHRGKPLVAVWGIGFSDGRSYTLAECRKLIEFIKNDKDAGGAGGCSVMIGVPTYWRELKNDAVNDKTLHEIIALADVVSPWMVGRLRNVRDVTNYYESTFKADLAWLSERKIDLLPVLYPGFSWHNMYGKQLDEIPRLKGEFLWSQFREATKAGATMGYVAMFDEVDEATAIFKCTNEVPVSDGVKFLTYEGLPSDYYLKLTGEAAKMIRGEVKVDEMKPKPLTATGAPSRKGGAVGVRITAASFATERCAVIAPPCRDGALRMVPYTSGCPGRIGGVGQSRLDAIARKSSASSMVICLSAAMQAAQAARIFCFKGGATVLSTSIASSTGPSPLCSLGSSETFTSSWAAPALNAASISFRSS